MATGFDLVRAALENALGRPPSLAAPTFQAVGFQYFVQPPAWATGLDAVNDEIHVPGLRGMDVVKRPGDGVDWRAGTGEYVAALQGAGRSHDEVKGIVAAAAAALATRYS